VGREFEGGCLERWGNRMKLRRTRRLAGTKDNPWQKWEKRLEMGKWETSGRGSIRPDQQEHLFEGWVFADLGLLKSANPLDQEVPKHQDHHGQDGPPDPQSSRRGSSHRYLQNWSKW